jgi:ribosome-binding protein aMBF1 (putative translation factor)
MNEETDFSAFIKNRITKLRCQKGISEYTLSLAIGRSQGYIQSISSGRYYPL